MRRPWGLRRRLLLALVVVTAVVTLAVGTASVAVLRSFLVGRLDDQLTSAVQRSSEGRDGPGGRPGAGPRGGVDGGPPFLLVPGQAAGTLGAEVDGGTVLRAAVLDAGGTPEPVPPEAYPALTGVRAGDDPRSVDVAGLGSYRVVAVGTPDGAVLVTGLPLEQVTSTTTRLAVVLLTATAAGCAVVLLAGGPVVRRAMRPLAEVTTTAARVRALDLSGGDGAVPDRVPARVARTPDEVGEVAAALNLMLDHVEDALLERHRSETRVRQFVADASHELRTPLASVRGYAELARRGPGPLTPDLAHALGRVEAEAGRMGDLVDDLLLLARLDAGRPVERQPVDLVPVVVTALADAHAAGPDHRWHLDLASEEPVVVVGDEARLRQVVTNLLANARVHTPPGTTVTLSLGRDPDASPGAGGEVLLRVADDGPGIPEDLRGSVFERFARGDGSRSRAAGSTGLGLSIVQAVVQAHGGRVACPPSPTGAVVEVRLPAAPS
ncbi:sensor histidine kinase [Aquipuribacter hungaricus]|uniref:histidine kinase n=1 Tax=Aquipuribacter hungaricus TaxID=545624 RepID=A0ABV7WG24_9MICO